MFGLIEQTLGRLRPTKLGFTIIDPTRERAAKAEAFLEVPLYRKTYDEYKGTRGISCHPVRFGDRKRVCVDLGVSSKQKEKARQAFDRSARVAGFFPTGQEDRLVAPVTWASLPMAAQEPQEVIAQSDSSTPNDGKAGACD